MFNLSQKLLSNYFDCTFWTIPMFCQSLFSEKEFFHLIFKQSRGFCFWYFYRINKFNPNPFGNILTKKCCSLWFTSTLLVQFLKGRRRADIFSSAFEKLKWEQVNIRRAQLVLSQCLCCCITFMMNQTKVDILNSLWSSKLNSFKF